MKAAGQAAGCEPSGATKVIVGGGQGHDGNRCGKHGGSSRAGCMVRAREEARILPMQERDEQKDGFVPRSLSRKGVLADADLELAVGEIHLPLALLERVDRLASRKGLSRIDVITQALNVGLRDEERIQDIVDALSDSEGLDS